MKNHVFNRKILHLDCEKVTGQITERLKQIMTRQLRKRGVVIGLSGGIDSSVSAALCVRAFGSSRVVGLLMPEKHSAEETLDISSGLAESLGVTSYHEDISGILESLHYYERYKNAIRKVIPEYDETWKSKIVIPSVLQNDGFNVFSIVAVSPDGEKIKKHLNLDAYLEIVAATNFKQRTRKMLEYYYADCHNYAVIGTPNRLEYDQGFFVKLGDGAADIKPIAHLYKTQVYQLAEYLEIPMEIRSRPPTTDTYSLPQGQDEFYFSLPYDKMDLCLYAKNHGIEPGIAGKEIGLTEKDVERVYKDIERKRSTTRYLHTPPLLVQKVEEISGI